MPKKKDSRGRVQPQEAGVRVTWTKLIAAVSGTLLILTLLGYGFNALKNIATKADIESIKASLAPTLAAHEARMTADESRIRDLELQNAAHFGASQTTFKSSSDDDGTQDGIRFLLASAQMPQAIPYGQGAPPPVPIPQKRTVVARELINRYGLRPSTGGFYTLLGEDGKLYSIDDVIWAVIQIHLSELPKK